MNERWLFVDKKLIWMCVCFFFSLKIILIFFRIVTICWVDVENQSKEKKININYEIIIDMTFKQIFSLSQKKTKIIRTFFFFQWRHQIFIIFISQNALRLNVKIINKRIIKIGDFFIIENSKWALTVLSMLKSKSNSKWIGKHDWNFNEEHHFSWRKLKMHIFLETGRGKRRKKLAAAYCSNRKCIKRLGIQKQKSWQLH